AAGTISNESADASYFDSPSKDVDNGEPKSAADNQKIKAIRLFLAYASFMGFVVYQMDVKSAFLYGTIEEEVYVTQPPGFKDLDHLDKVYKVVKALYGLHQAPRAWHKFQMSSMGELTFFLGLQVQQKEDGIFISQDKFVAVILKKFNYTGVKSASIPVDLEKPLVKDGDADDVDVHLYRSMIGSLMYLTTSRPDIMFAYSGDSPFELVAYTDSDYAGATQDWKSTTRGCQFLGNRLISWQCKKQTVVATSTTEAEYVAAASCCGQVGDEALHKELGDRIEMAATIASSLEADFGATAKANTVNGERQLQALIDKKKVVITESSIRSDLHLEDAGGTDCLPTATIFEELARMGYEKPSQKLTFYKAFFSPQWKFLIHTITQCLSAKSTASYD
ncbi:putative ribonuclease H-like domain-containing protein, partial [Tanacetum coccineum]